MHFKYINELAICEDDDDDGDDEDDGDEIEAEVMFTLFNFQSLSFFISPKTVIISLYGSSSKRSIYAPVLWPSQRVLATTAGQPFWVVVNLAGY